MKILYVLGFLPTYVKREIDSLAALGHDVSVLLPATGGPDNTSDFWHSITSDQGTDGVTSFREMRFDFFTSKAPALILPLLRSLNHPGALWQALKESELRYFLTASAAIRSIQNQDKPDVIHAHFAQDQAHVARIMASVLKVPFTVTTHATDIFVPKSRDRLKRVLRDAAAVFTISEYNRIFLKQNGLSKRNAVVLKLGLNVAELPERITPSCSPVGVCTASGLVEKKGIHVLLEAAEILQEEYPDLHFIVIGSDPDESLLRKYRRLSASVPVEFTGSLSSEETLKTVAGATFFILPCVEAANGDRDGIPVALMEAMGMGVPCISTGVSGIPELILHRESGLLAEPGSSSDLAAMVRTILDSRSNAEITGKKGRERVIRIHSTEKSIEIITSVFNKVIENNSRSEG